MRRAERLVKIAELGSKFNILLPESDNFAENVANFLVLNKKDGGGQRVVILPKMQPSRSKTRKIFIHLNDTHLF